jgi:hypothetical protein
MLIFLTSHPAKSKPVVVLQEQRITLDITAIALCTAIVAYAAQT